MRSCALLASLFTASTAALLACGDDGSQPLTGDVPGADAADGSPSPDDRDAGDLDAGDADPAPDYDASDELVVCSGTPCATQLAAGANHFCALLSDGTVRCWGHDHRGALGRGQLDGSDAGVGPRPVVGMANATQISAAPAGSTTCARTADGDVRCWGDNSSGQLGLAPPPDSDPYVLDSDDHTRPTKVSLSVSAARVDVGQYTACAIGADDKVYCWGLNDSRQLARPASTSSYESPGAADLEHHLVTRLTLSGYSSFGLTTDGRLLNWGRASGRDSSLPHFEGSARPVPLPTLSGVTRTAASGSLSGGDDHVCAIAGGKVYCWGENGSGALGTGVPDSERLPALAGILAGDRVYPQQLAVAPKRTCVRMTNGTIQCCGTNELGQLGRGDAGPFVARFGRATAFDQHAVQVATSSNTTCALVQGGKVMCWGGNTYGELGQGTADPEPHPTPVRVVFE